MCKSQSTTIFLFILSSILGMLLLVACTAPATTPAPSPVPSPKPTSTPVASPSPTTVPAPPATGELKFEFVSVTRQIKKGDELTVVGKTSPGTECTIVMTFANGQVSNLVFPPPANKQVADANGRVEWKGTVARVIIGETKLDVTAVKDGKTVTASTTYQIIE